MASTAAPPVPVMDKALSELRAKFERYSIGSPRMLNLAGFRYLFKSSPGLTWSDDELQASFLRAAGEGGDVKSKLTLDQFVAGLRTMASSMFVGAPDSDTALLNMLAHHIVPHILDEGDVAAAVGHPGWKAQQTTAGAPSAPVPPVAEKPAAAPSTAGPPSAPASTPTVVDDATSLPDLSARLATAMAALVARTPAPAPTPTPTPAPAPPAATSSAHAFQRAEELLQTFSIQHTGQGYELRTSSGASTIIPGTSSRRSSGAGSRDHSASKGPHSANGANVLHQFLAALRLEAFVPALTELGLDRVEDVEELTAKECERMGMKPLHVKRLHEALELWKSEAKSAADVQRLLSELRLEHGVPHPVGATPARYGDVDTRPAATAASAAAVKELLSPTTASNVESLVGTYEWEEYATADGFLYYHHPKTNATQWLRPPSKSIRTVAIRAAEQAAVSALVERRVQQVLGSRAGGDGSDGVGSGAQTPMVSASAPPMLASGVKTGGAAHVAYEGLVASLPSDATSRTAMAGATPNPAAHVVGSSTVLGSDQRWGNGSSGRDGARHGDGAPSPGLRTPPNRLDVDDPALVSYYAGYMGQHRAAGLSSPPPAFSSSRGVDKPMVGDSASPPPSMAGPPATMQSAYGVTLGAAPRAGGGYLAPPTPMRTPGMGGARRAGRLGGSVTGGSGASVVGSEVGEGGGRDDGQSGPPGPGSVAPDDDRTAFSFATSIYPDLYESLPTMDEKTFEVLARHTAISNSKRMGYADPRPDIRPSHVLMPVAGTLGAGGSRNPLVHVEPRQALDLGTNPTSRQSKADSVFASGLRAGLHSATQDPKAPRTAEGIKHMWSAGGTAPSEASIGYAYRHAAAASIMGEGGDVYDRLTDVRGYTGTHRHRFGSDGRGKGLAGRDNSFDYKYLVASVPVEPSKGAPVLPTLHGLLDHASSTGKR